MNIKLTLNYSPNFNPKKRKASQIKFIIFHYTGMTTDSASLNRLTNTQSEVSSHYLIKNNGEVVMMVPDLYIAWHAGKSYWKNFKSLNKNSIGIEISNPGHNLRYKKFSKKQVQSILKISKFLIRKYKIKKKNILGHSDIAPNRKKDPGEKFIVKKLGIERFNFHQRKKFSINRLLKFYGFSQNYIKIHKADCIKAVKRSLNYKTIDSSVSKNFKNKFNNLLFK